MSLTNTQKILIDLDTLDENFGKENIKLCKKHGFMTHLKEWNYCPYCGEELCE